MKMVLALIALLPATAMAQEITVTNPRQHGWWLGDQLQQQIRITLPPGKALDPSSLPRPRAVDYWLDLRELRQRTLPGAVELTLVWQNFYSALEPSLREVPSSPLRLMDGTRLYLPGFSYVTSPLRPILAPSVAAQMQADPPYHLIDQQPGVIRLVLALVALAAGMAALAWHQGWGPFARRAARPFTRARRQIRRQGTDQARPILHRAFDAAFGRVLIGADLDGFLAQAPQYGPLRDRLQAFFAASDAVYFGTGQPSDPAQDLAQLARDLAAIERGRR